MRFFLSILGVVAFIVVVIVIIATHSTPKSPAKPINLVNYNIPSSSVTQISSGFLVADSVRQAIRINVTQNNVEIDILNGYNQTISKTESFTNNSTSYGVFLGALQNAMFTSSRVTSQINIFGVCPVGETFQYQFYNGAKTASNLWSTSCSFSDGNFAGNGPLIRQLFALQIPNYRDFTSTVNSSLSGAVL